MTNKVSSHGIRRVRGLTWAELREESPFKAKKPRKASIKKGLAYEKVVGRELKRLILSNDLDGELFLGQWIIYADQHGTGWAQPDAYLLMKDQILLLEIKLTQNDSAVPQLLSLYLPLLRHLYNLPILCGQVCRNLRYIPKKFVESPQEILAKPGPGVFTWHFIG